MPGAALSPFADVCVNGSPIKLAGGTPFGGYYTGPGVSAGYFYPGNAGVGTWTITYNVYISGVLQTATATIKVNPKPNSPSPITSGTLPFVGTGNSYGGTNCPNGSYAYSTPGCAGKTENYCIPLVSGNTYRWAISNIYGASYATGGTIVGSNNSNCVNIKWDGTNFIKFWNGGEGYYTLFKIVQENTFGCYDSSYVFFQIDKPPVPNFTSTVSCLGDATQFTDQSTDAVQWYWDFGDGTTSTDKDPKHVFATPGTHTVKLVTKSGCYCSDSITKTVTIASTPAPPISCPSTFCPGTKSSYSTNPVCGSYNWTVTGGTITSGQGTPNIQVDWGANGPAGSVSLQTSSCTPAECSSPSTSTVPLIPPTSNITGNQVVCAYETDDYTLPSFPGTDIEWSIVPASAGTILNGQGSNDVQIQWGAAGTAQIVATINHAILSCPSTTTLNVTILPYFYLTTNDYQVCKDGTTTLTTNPSGNVNWSVPDGSGTVTSGQGTPTGTVQWKNAGSHMVVAKPSSPNTFCNDSAIAYVYVDTIYPPPIDGPIYICPGGTYKYSSLGPNYYTNYSWSVTGGSVISASGNDVYVTWNNTGPYSLTVVESMGYDPFCVSAPETIPVYDITAKSPPITGRDSTCVNDMYSYSVPYLNGAGYSWSVNPPQAGSIIYGQGTSGISIEFTTTGPVTITCNTYLCTNPIVSTFNVIVNPSPKPTITSAGYMCPVGGSVTLATTGGYQSYSWSPSGATGQTAIVSTPGYHIVYVTAKNGCVGKEKIYVPLQKAPIAHISTPDRIHYCSSETVNTNLDAILGGGSSGSYQWYKTGGVTVGTNSSVYNATDTGTYWMIVTNAYGCTAISNKITIDKVACSTPPPGCIPLPMCGLPPCTPPPPSCFSTDTVDVSIKAGFKLYGGGGTKNGGGKGFQLQSTATILKICKTKVNFVNTSLKTTTQWYWDFGDGGSSLLENPTYDYGWPGYYYVTFVGVFPSGLIAIKNQSIEVPFKANFQVDASCGGATFTDLSLYTTGSSIANWQWDFGDGTTSTLQNPSHTYPAPGTYNIKLTVSDLHCSSSDSAVVTIPPPPTAAFTAPAACITFPTTFTDASTGTAGLYDWHWDFGDGYISNNPDPVHTYGAAGNYNVTLTVTDITGCTGTITHTVVVSAPTGGGSITANGPTTFCYGGNVLLTATAAASYQWSDGETSEYILATNPGYYSCTVTYATGCIEQIPAIYINTLSAPWPYMYSSVDTSICAGTTAYFYASYGTDYSYQWYQDGSAVAGANTYNFSTTTTGSYYVVITDNSTGCSTTTTPKSITSLLPTPVISSVSGNTSICHGTNTTLSASASGGTGTLTYYWTNGASTPAITVKTGGTYYLNVYDHNGCVSSTYTTVTENPLPNLNGFPIGCYDMCYKDTLRVIGGMASYQWYFNGSPIPPPVGTSQNMIVLNSGTYSLVATTTAGCTDTSGKVDLTTKPLPKVTAGPDGTICQAGGEVDTLQGATDGVTFNWTPVTALSDPNILNPIASPTANQDYILHAKASNGCKNSDTVTVLVSCTNPKVTVQGASTCVNTCVSLIGIKPGGGTQPYTYSWSSGQTGIGPNSVCPVTTTVYTVTITDAAGYTGTDTAMVYIPPSVTSFAATLSNPKCVGSSNGTLAVAPAGGVTPYKYLWSTGDTTNSITGLTATNYSVTITDSKGCTRDTVLSLINPVVMSPLSSTVDAACGQSNGSMSVAVTGGTGAYTYSWSPLGGIAQTTTNTIPAGNYTVVVTDANGCTVSTTAVVANNPGTLTATTSLVNNVSCKGFADGKASVAAAGGFGSYTYSWKPSGGNSLSANGLGAGTYSVVVMDSLGCQLTSTVTITEPTALTAATAAVSPNCPGGTGTANVTAAGGTVTYTYSWMPGGAASQTITGLANGQYTVTVTDANGCIQISTASVNVPPPIVLIASGVNGSCGNSNGTASINASGGTPAYSYSWQPGGAVSQTITALAAATYTVTMTDSKGCTQSASQVIGNTPPVSITAAAPANVTCHGGNDGSAVATVAGGTGTMTYSWLPSGGNAATANALTATTYTVAVLDAAGCTATSTVTITEPPAVAAAVPAVSTICIGQNTTLNANASGGTPGYSYSWTPGGSTTSSINVNPIITTTYTVAVTDSKGCTTTPQTVTVTVNPPLQVDAGVNKNICIGGSASMTAIAAGGDGNYTYNWLPMNSPGSTLSVTPTANATYTVVVNDGCGTPSANDTVMVVVNLLPQPTFVADTTQGCAPVCVKFTNNTPGVMRNCNWVFGDNSTSTNCTDTHCYTKAGSYSIRLSVTDTNGCSAFFSRNNYITVWPVPTAEFKEDPRVTTIVTPTISFTDQSSSDVIKWNWNFGDLFNAGSTDKNPTYTYQDTGVYQVILKVTNSYGCVAIDTDNVIIQGDYTFYVPNAFTPNGDGKNETFFPQGVMINPDCYRMLIFDRWGNNIFSTSDLNVGWNGKANGGKDMAQQDVYVWKIETCDFKKERHYYIGHVTLVR